MSVEIRSRFDGHERPKGFESVNPTMTKQEFKTECDINVIMDSFQVMHTPLIDPMVQRSGEPIFGDFSEIPNLQEAQNKLIEAENLFMQLPSSIRKRFNNDPVSFVDFCQRPENENEMRELGILPKLHSDAFGRQYYFRDGLPVFLDGKGVRPAELTQVKETETAV